MRDAEGPYETKKTILPDSSCDQEVIELLKGVPLSAHGWWFSRVRNLISGSIESNSILVQRLIFNKE
jgi:hypothetical protein